MAGHVKVESGLSLLSRLVSRPRVDTCLGPGLGPLSSSYTCVNVTGEEIVICILGRIIKCNLVPGEYQDSVTLLSSYSLDLVIRTLLPRRVKEVELGKGSILLKRNLFFALRQSVNYLCRDVQFSLH